jgi:hypothetical protein
MDSDLLLQALTGGALSSFSAGDMRALGAPPPVVALCQWHGAAVPQAPSPAGAYRKPQRPVVGSARGSGRARASPSTPRFPVCGSPTVPATEGMRTLV